MMLHHPDIAKARRAVVVAAQGTRGDAERTKTRRLKTRGFHNVPVLRRQVSDARASGGSRCELNGRFRAELGRTSPTGQCHCCECRFLIRRYESASELQRQRERQREREQKRRKDQERETECIKCV